MSPDSAPESPVLFAYDGSDHAKAAIEQAGRELRTGRPALVLTVWQTLRSIPFAQMAIVPDEVAEAMAETASKTAAEGVELAKAAGFHAAPLVEAGAPVWARIVEAADENDTAVVVIGSHGRSGVTYAAMGSVATAVAHHTKRPVLVTRMA